MWSPGGPGAAAGTRDYLSIEGDVVGVELQPARLCGHLLAITHCLRQYVDHRQSALDLGGQSRILALRTDSGVQIADRRQQYPGFAQRRQHLADVVEERGVGPDDEDTALAELLTVRVQQIRCSVQCHGRLAGARSALHHQHTAML
ncbi:unannotated protein [freshwater metagenome]|uniref:Unannotated protein n=1 Tax=freshwater metagenome TaxID=449393 RepID=A0A6J7DZL5_9ZZZZ